MMEEAGRADAVVRARAEMASYRGRGGAEGGRGGPRGGGQNGYRD